MTTSHETSVAPLSDEELNVAEYLRAHPEFFVGHVELLEYLHLNHTSGQAVSLIERQVAHLRDKNQRLRKQLNELLANARENDRLNSFIHRITLDLLQARTAGDVVRLLHLQLREQFPAELLSLVLLAPPMTPESLDSAPPSSVQLAAANDPNLHHFSTPLGQGHAICGRPKAVQLEFLFRGEAPRIGSAAIIPLRARRSDEALGLLAVGSPEVNRFNPAMGTLFINQLGEIISCALEQYL
jgi:uncharacterized protein YigA (DUF484 family)